MQHLPRDTLFISDTLAGRTIKGNTPIVHLTSVIRLRRCDGSSIWSQRTRGRERIFSLPEDMRELWVSLTDLSPISFGAPRRMIWNSARLRLQSLYQCWWGLDELKNDYKFTRNLSCGLIREWMTLSMECIGMNNEANGATLIRIGFIDRRLTRMGYKPWDQITHCAHPESGAIIVAHAFWHCFIKWVQILWKVCPCHFSEGYSCGSGLTGLNNRRHPPVITSTACVFVERMTKPFCCVPFDFI